MNHRPARAAHARQAAAILAGALWVLPVSAEQPPALRQIMQHLAREMCGLGNAVWMEDYGAIARHASAIAHHEPAGVAERQAIGQRLGAKAQAFHKADEAVHQAASSVADAASQEDMNEVLRAYSLLLNGCVACHDAFRSELRQGAASH